MSDLKHSSEDENILLQFSQDSSHRNIATGTTPDKEATAVGASKAGCTVLETWKGRMLQITQKKIHVVKMSLKLSVNVEGRMSKSILSFSSNADGNGCRF